MPSSSRNLRPRLAFAALAAAMMVMGAGAAHAQVLEIGDNGVVVHDRPEVFTAAGAAPIQPLRSAPVTFAPGALAKDAAEHAGVSPALVEAVAWRESRGRLDAISPKGAIGAMQLMPQTARALGVDPHDAAQNYRGGATYLARMLNRFGGDVGLALAAYNAGPGAVERYGGAPPFKETRAYVAAIMDRLSRMTASASIIGEVR